MQAASSKVVKLVNFTRQVPYREALDLQRKLQTSLIAQARTPQAHPGAVYLLQHPGVYTLGRGSKEENVLDKTVECIRVERGGEVTYHGPGQLVGYLVLDLQFFKKDLHWLVRNVEETIIQTAKSYDIPADRSKGRTGVWVGNSKIAAIGLGAKQWVTIHGFALNMKRDVLNGFQRIVPCGISADSGQVTCLESLVPVTTTIDEDDVKRRIIESLRHVFDISFDSLDEGEFRQKLN